MTPQELKAREILIKMQFQSQPLMFEQAKQCALIAVDEIIKALDDDIYIQGETDINSFIYSWQQVKHQIQQL